MFTGRANGGAAGTGGGVGGGTSNVEQLCVDTINMYRATLGLAPYTRWKEVIKKELDPVKGMMQGKLKLKGDLPTIVRYVKAANELVNLAQTVPTEFADEVAS